MQYGRFCNGEWLSILISEQEIRKKLNDLALQLGDPCRYYPGRMDACIEQLSPLFQAEETLMIRAGYPDYLIQQSAHRTFLHQLRYPADPGSFFENESQASNWLFRHDQIRDFLFRSFLTDRIPESGDPVYTAPLPDNIQLHPRFLS